MRARYLNSRDCDTLIQELNTVTLIMNYPDQVLMNGDIGAMTIQHGGRKASELEFDTLAVDTLRELTLTADKVRAISARDVPHVRVA